MTQLDLSPSIYHRRLMDRIRPALSYRGGDVRAWQRKLRVKVRELVGLGDEERVPLRPRTLWRREHKLGVIEKITFRAEPGADVLAYLCLPHKARPPYDLMICLQGHTTGAHHSIGVERDDESKPMAVEGDRDFGIGCMKRGLAALCVEQRSFGLRRELVQEKVAPSGCQDAAMHALMLGKTLLGERVYDVDRAIDYLEARGDINMKTLGVMGNSGGGTLSLFSAALLPRVRFAMPSCYFCTFRDSIMSIHHCVDNYVPGLLKVAEMWDVMGLFAPRPVVLVAGKKDPIFPIDAVHRSFANLKKIYRAAGAPNNCRLVVGSQGHRFYARQGWAAALPMIEALR